LLNILQFANFFFSQFSLPSSPSLSLSISLLFLSIARTLTSGSLVAVFSENGACKNFSLVQPTMKVGIG
ncbi:hypothetical protein LINPERPRIM_LOCUS21753, partial [Linum perenne]